MQWWNNVIPRQSSLEIKGRPGKRDKQFCGTSHPKASGMLGIGAGMQIPPIFGDSLNVVNWFNVVERCHNISLLPIYDEIIQLKSSFDIITCCHIYREQYAEACVLSKAGARQDQGIWQVSESVEGSNLFHQH